MGHETGLSNHPRGRVDRITPTYDTRATKEELDLLLPSREQCGEDVSEGSDLCNWWATLNRVFGYRLLILLFATQHCNKGFALSFTGKAAPYMYKTYHIPAPSVQLYSGISHLPWALKPVVGLASDIFPICGYNKAPYITLAASCGTIGFFCAGFLPQESLPIMGFVTCLFFIAVQASVCDLLTEAKYAERMKEHPAHGPSMLTYVWFGLHVGGLIGTIVSGLVLAHYGPKMLYLVAAFPAAFVLVPVAAGYLEERKQSEEEVAVVRRAFCKQKEACCLCILMLAATFTLIATTLISRDPFKNAIAAICVASVVLVAFSAVLSPVIAKANAFALIQTALGFSTGGATFYFYTDTPEQYPEGPHFSEFFYVSIMGVVGSLISLIGIFCYQRYMTTWKYRSLLVATNVALACLSILDTLMFARVNVKYGIPDHALVLGLSVFEGIIFQWQWMPQVVILSYLCPKGMEATMYALLAGCHNLGSTIASSCGALLLERLGCKPTGAPNESSQFENLWQASAISTVCHLVAVILLIRLIPDARQNERIVDEEVTDATDGSLLRRWQGRD